MTVYQVNAFSKNGAGGNGAGVVVNPPTLTAAEKTAIAKTMGYSETVWISPSAVADFKLEYFTPEGEVPLCGHATIGAFLVLDALVQVMSGVVYTIETKAGVLAVVLGDDGAVKMEQSLPTFYDLVPQAQVAGCFAPIVYDGTLPIQMVSTGLKDILLAVDGEATLGAMTPDFDAITAVSRDLNCVGIHAFALIKSKAQGITAVCRNFAPLYGIDEEAATGTSNCALACYLFRHGHKQTDYVFEQGHQLGSVSQIRVQLETKKAAITRVWVGGTGYLLGEREIEG